MRLTLVHPAIGRKPGVNYMRTWQMEPLPIAALAGLTPPDVAMTFFDDRMEAIDFDAPADLVAIPVETYTAKRAYQIASEFRRRRVPVIMGGFHATLAPDEVGRYADSVVVGEAEGLWPRVIEDARGGRLQRLYKANAQPRHGVDPLRPASVQRQVVPSHSTGGDRTRLQVPVRVLRHPDRSSIAPRDGGRSATSSQSCRS